MGIESSKEQPVGSDELFSNLPLQQKEAEAEVLLKAEQTRVDEFYSVEENIPSIQDNSDFEYNYETLEIPKDKDGNVLAFTLNQEKSIREFWDKFGFVVISECITDGQCQKSEGEVWTFLTSHYDKVEEDDPNTWKNENWPSVEEFGVFDSIKVPLSSKLCKNRQNEEIYGSFSTILNTKRLLSSFSSVLALRPTKNIKIAYENSDEHENSYEYCKEKGFEPERHVVDKEDWKTQNTPTILNMNPWTGLVTTSGYLSSLKNEDPYQNLKIFGYLSITDCDQDSGGISLIPGFHRHVRGWANKNVEKCNKETQRKLEVIVPDDEILKDLQKITLKKGSLLLYHCALPISVYENNSSNFTFGQYLRLVPCDEISIEKCSLVAKFLPKPPNFQMTDLGKKLFGHREWKNKNN